MHLGGKNTEVKQPGYPQGQPSVGRDRWGTRSRGPSLLVPTAWSPVTVRLSLCSHSPKVNSG